MNPPELERYLRENIPLVQAMQVGVEKVAGDGVVLTAPLGPNLNHRGTLFGGSASAVATLSAWSLVHVLLAREDIPSRIVIRRNTMEYERPVTGDFTARSFLPPEADWERFLAVLRRVGMARISVAAELEFGGAVAARFSGDFVALDNAAASGEGRLIP